MMGNEGDFLIQRVIEILDRDPEHWRKIKRAAVGRHWASIMIAIVLGWLITGDHRGLVTLAFGASGALALVYFEPPPIKTSYKRRVK